MSRVADLGVVLATRNSARRLADFLSPLERSLAAADIDCELVVLDDGSDDDTAEVAARAAPSATVISSAHRRGMASARNAGVAQLSADWLLFVDDDLRISAAALDRLWRARTSAPCLVPAVRSPAGVLQNAVTARWRRWDVKFQHHREPIPEVAYPMGACVLISRAMLSQIGGWDERFAPLYYEDVALGFATWRAGGRVVMVSDAHAEHLTHGGGGSLVPRRRLVYRNRWVFAGSSLAGNRRAAVMIAALPRTAVEAARLRQRGPLVGYFEALRVLARTRHTHPTTPGTLSDRELFRRLEAQAPNS
jgi:O-antigen biosynthesis protein